MVTIIPLRGIDIRLVPGVPWPVSDDMRAAAARHWTEISAANRHLWDGRILGAVVSSAGDLSLRIEHGVLHAEAREEAFSVFLHWRDAGFPEIGIRNLFGSALIVSSDGALIFGLMGGATANAGRVYPPGGSLEPTDVDDEGRVDVLASIKRELEEETGLSAGEARPGGMVAAFDGPRISIARLFHFDTPAETLAKRIRANLAAQHHPELDDVVIVRSAADAAAAGSVPPYAAALADAGLTALDGERPGGSPG